MAEETLASPLIYTPAVAPQPPAKPTEYVLVDDVTHEPPPKRGPFILTVPIEDDKGKPTTMQIQVPNPAKASCNKCHGRGYIGVDTKSGKVLLCHRCYRGREVVR